MKALTVGVSNNKDMLSQSSRYFGSGFGGEL